MNHQTKDGRTMPLSEMTDSHLLNTIRFFRRRAIEGVTVAHGGGGPDCEDMWYDEDVVFGEDAEEALHIPEYVKEAKRRGLRSEL